MIIFDSPFQTSSPEEPVQVHCALLVIRGWVRQWTCSKQHYISNNENYHLGHVKKNSRFITFVQIRRCEVNHFKFWLHCKKCNLKLERDVHVKLAPVSADNKRVTAVCVICKFDFDEVVDELDIICRKIEIMCLMSQSLMADMLFMHYGTRRVFDMESKEGKVIIHILGVDLSREQCHRMSPQALWKCVAEKLVTPPFINPKRKFIAFLASDYLGSKKMESLLEVTKAQLGLGTGGLALFGCDPTQSTWPEHVDEIEEKLFDNGHFQFGKSTARKSILKSISKLKCNVVFNAALGVLCHELGHLLDLVHAKYGVMSNNYLTVGRSFVSTEPLLRMDLAQQDEEHFDCYLDPANAAILYYHSWSKGVLHENQSINQSSDASSSREDDHHKNTSTQHCPDTPSVPQLNPPPSDTPVPIPSIPTAKSAKSFINLDNNAVLTSSDALRVIVLTTRPPSCHMLAHVLIPKDQYLFTYDLKGVFTFIYDLNEISTEISADDYMDLYLIAENEAGCLLKQDVVFKLKEISLEEGLRLTQGPKLGRKRRLRNVYPVFLRSAKALID